MRSGIRTLRRPAEARRRAYQPAGEGLESRVVPVAIDLIDIADLAAPFPGPGPFGVQEVGNRSAGGAGFSTAIIGDVNGDGFEDFLVGEPTVTGSAALLDQFLADTGTGLAYLVLGSSQTGGFTRDFLSLAPQERVGLLNQLGTVGQINPVNGQPGFDFNGVTFQTSLGGDLLGASVAGVPDLDGDGLGEILIGAPGVSRAYLVFGDPLLSTITAAGPTLVNLDLPPLGLRVLTFQGPSTFLFGQSQAGRSVAAVGNVIGDPTPDIAIGAPNDISGDTQNPNGTVYVIDGAQIPTFVPGSVINLTRVGQNSINDPAGVQFTGTAAAGSLDFSLAGFSVAGAGDVDLDGMGDLLIGSPGQRGFAGDAYLIYGAVNLQAQAALNPAGLVAINLSRIGTAIVGAGPAVPGADFQGSTGDFAGFSVSSAGDFNGDGPADILIGSPAFQALTGRVSLIYGQAQPNPIVNIITLNQPPNVVFATFQGDSPGALAGFSVSPLRDLTGDFLNEILIGSPGAELGNGVVYAIPGSTTLTGNLSLEVNSVQLAPVNALVIRLSDPPFSNLGVSVAGRLEPDSPTLDGDAVPDFILGAPAYQLDATTPINAGTAFAIEGGLLVQGGVTPQPPTPQPPVPTPVFGAVPVSINFSQLDLLFPPPNAEVPRFGERLIPQRSILGKLRYKPIPVRRAYRQFLPTNGFGRRFRNFFRPEDQQLGSANDDSQFRTSTLGRDVFTRGRFRAGQIRFPRIDHGLPTIPPT